MRNELMTEVLGLSQAERKEVAVAAAQGLPAAYKEAVVSEADLQPDQWVINFIWGALVVAVAITLIASAGAMTWVFIQTGRLDPGAMLTVFTTVMGFIGGLLVKSPVQN